MSARQSLILVLLLLLPLAAARAQTWVATPLGPGDAKLQPPEPPREFRAAWVATVANIDWPSRRDLTTAQQQAEMKSILDAAAAMNLNALVLQVRPACDAIYPSRLEPWSEFLTGLSGRPPSPLYDPLAEWIAGAHARGIELHAWVNPFRARHFQSKQPDAASHITKTRPDLVRTYGQYLWLDPGEPEARTHGLAVVADLIQRYDLDGVHIDDYFYPYPEKNLSFPDDRAWNAFNATPSSPRLSRNEWRRRNIDDFVRDMYQLVKRERPHIKVGISPFGIWRPGFPPEVRGFDAFESLNADARRWTREGWLDYVAPQLYWKAEAPQQPFNRLLHWWIDQNDQLRHVWPGVYTSRILPAELLGSKPPTDAKGRDSWEPSDITRQIDLTRASAGGSTGHIHFSMIALMQNRRGTADALRTGPYARPALVPASPWLAGSIAPPVAPAVQITPTNAALNIAWQSPEGSSGRWTLVSWRTGDSWSHRLEPLRSGAATLPQDGPGAAADVIAVRSLDNLGRLGPAAVWQRR